MSNPLPTKKLEGKVAIITGGASGIGEATARKFAEHGTRMVVIADVQEEKGLQVAESIGPERCTFIKCDVSNEQQVESLVKSTVEKFGQLDIMYSNAGIMSKGKQDMLSFDLDSFDRLFSVNVRGMATCVKHAARAMVDGGVKGNIICTDSVLSNHATAVVIDYTMSKYAVLGLVKCASKGLGEYGIRVNCVSPALVATPLACGPSGLSVEEMEEKFEGDFHLKQWGHIKVENIADAVLFLAGDDSRYITGHNLVVDRGYVPTTIE